MEIKQIITNVNNVKKLRSNNVKPNVKRKAYQYNIDQVQRTASLLCEKLNDPNSFEYYCKVAWGLTESSIWANLEQAKAGRNPRAYFTFLCNLELGKTDA